MYDCKNQTTRYKHFDKNKSDAKTFPELNNSLQTFGM